MLSQLKPYPTFSEFQDNQFQIGFVEALRRVVWIAQEAESMGATDEQISSRCQDYVLSALHRYEPGHDKSPNSF
jgi:hypothetical protein